MTVLYHVSGWSHLRSVHVGDVFILRPGTQCAEGVGVYFSEGETRVRAAEGARGIPSAIICIEVVEDNQSWWQSKASKARKFGKPRTWHSDGKSIKCQVHSVEGERILHCSWSWQ